jgi:5-methylcytosine-specific restriction endonuclease McrA
MTKLKLELNKLERNCDNKTILEEICRVANIISSPFITRRGFDKHSKISSSTVVKRFGSWGDALRKANLEDRYTGLLISDRMREQKGKRMSDDELVEELCKVANLLGTKKLTIEKFNRHGSISSETIRRRFGSWWAALDKAGLQISNLGKRYSEKDYFENLLKVWTSHGRQPKYREMGEPPSTISSGAYEVKYGGWRKALVAFIERVNSDIESSVETKPSPLRSVHLPHRKKTKSSRVRSIPIGVRYDVLKRDHFKCVLCGDSPAINLKCSLQIDHIHPFSQGGKTTKDNLRILCSKCNQGKAAKIE